MKNPEKNGVAKLGYAATMIIVTTAILICTVWDCGNLSQNRLPIKLHLCISLPIT